MSAAEPSQSVTVRPAPTDPAPTDPAPTDPAQPRLGLGDPALSGVAAPATGGSSGPARRIILLATVVAAGWLVAGVATVLHVDVVLLPLLVVSVASVLRAGRNVVDRLMLSTVLVAATVITAGLLFSVWPWGLSPFPVAGFLFTVVAVGAWLGRRRPALPRGYAASDLVIVGTGLFVFLAELRPILRLSDRARLPFVISSEDRAAHFAFFDTIHRLGSYPFLSQSAARVSLQSPAEATYPVGSHFLYAVIDIFGRSSVDAGAAIPTMNRYFLLVLAGYAFFVMSTVWAARWILAPHVRGWRVFAATSAVAALLVGGPLMNLVSAGFDSQIQGLMFVGLVAAIAIRPPHPTSERVALLGAGIILVAYTYYLYLPLTAVVVLASFVVDRRVLRRAWRPIAGTAVFVGAVSLVPIYFAATSKLNLGAQALAHGATFQIPRSTIVAMTVASLAVLLAPTALRYRRVRTAALSIVALLGMTLLFGAYQTVRLGTTSYYFEKLLTCYLLVAIICSASLAVFLRPLRGSEVRPWGARLREIGLGLTAAAIALAAIAGFGVGSGGLGNPVTGGWASSPLGQWYSGKRAEGAIGAAANNELLSLLNHGFIADGTPTLFLVSDECYVNWRISFVNSVLNRDAGTVQEPVNAMQNAAACASLNDKALDATVNALITAVSSSPVRIRLVVRKPSMFDAVNQAVAARPDLKASVVLVS